MSIGKSKKFNAFYFLKNLTEIEEEINCSFGKFAIS